MEPTSWILIAAILIIVVIAGSKIFEGGERKRSEIDPLYVRGLEAMVKDNINDAIQLLKASIESNPSSIAPYLLLGDLLRDRGDIERSLKIHRELSVRPNLDKDRKTQVLKSLVRDHIDSGQSGEAVEVCRKLLELDRKDRETLELLLISYEGKHMWNEALETAKKIAKLFLEDGKSYIAHYLSFIAREEYKEDREAAKKKLKRALTYDPACPAAQIYLGDIYFEEKNFEKAIELWSNVLEKKPEAIRDLSTRLEKAYFEGGHFGKMTEVYENLSHDLPSNPAVLIGLSRMYYRKGEVDAALRLALEARDLDATNPEMYSTLIELYSEKEDQEPLHSLLKGYFGKREEEFHRHDCKFCSYSSEEFFLKCPQCRKWQIDFEEKVH